MSTPDDCEFAYWHRQASEHLLRAVTRSQRVIEQLDMARDYGKRGLLTAANVRERMLATGLLMTVEGVRILVETGLETAPIDKPPHG